MPLLPCMVPSLDRPRSPLACHMKVVATCRGNGHGVYCPTVQICHHEHLRGWQCGQQQCRAVWLAVLMSAGILN